MDKGALPLHLTLRLRHGSQKKRELCSGERRGGGVGRGHSRPSPWVMTRARTGLANRGATWGVRYGRGWMRVTISSLRSGTKIISKDHLFTPRYIKPLPSSSYTSMFFK